MICHQNVEPSEALHAPGYKFLRSFSSLQIALHRGAFCLATFADQFRGLRFGFLVIKEDPRASFDKHSHRRLANPTRAACDQRDFAI